MEYQFRLQDPTSPQTVYLFEEIIRALTTAESWRGIFAFASRDGVDSLFLDPVTVHFLLRGRCSLVVGIDAVTNRATLERLQEIENNNNGVEIRVFWNPIAGLFHPKVCHFRHPDGQQTVIVGSGNLTPGGMRNNFEAFSVLRTTRRERLELAAWDDFLRAHQAALSRIDDAALERAGRNVVRGGRRGARVVEADIIEQPVPPPTPLSRMLVAQIPAAGGRWNQAHFNRDVVDQFFRIQPQSPQRVFLRQRRADGSLGDEEVRPLVLSGKNLNPKIELGAAAHLEYPANTPPVAVFRELQVRAFEYVLLMPGDPGYNQMLNFTQTHQSLGRGLPRILTDVGQVRGAWPQCPIC